MSISHADFLRLLPRALGGLEFETVAGGFEARSGDARIRIRLGPERTQRFASLELPLTEVRISLSGFAAGEAEAFMNRFDLAYRRGGG